MGRPCLEPGNQMVSTAQQRAQARYDEKRGGAVNTRFSRAELIVLDAMRRPGETRQAVLRRCAGFAKCKIFPERKN